MLSIWEKIPTTYGPTDLGWPMRCRDTECEHAARWIHRWETKTSGSQMDFYCEKHALEHGLIFYQDDPPSTPDPQVMMKHLQAIEQLSQESTIPYGGHPEDRIFENEAEASEDEKEVE